MISIDSAPLVELELELGKVRVTGTYGRLKRQALADAKSMPKAKRTLKEVIFMSVNAYNLSRELSNLSECLA